MEQIKNANKERFEAVLNALAAYFEAVGVTAQKTNSQEKKNENSK